MSILNEKQIVKIGRKTQIFEFNDNLQVNDFYHGSGVIATQVHGRFSKINLTLVDIKQGGGSNAKVMEFNIDPKAFKKFARVIGEADPVKYAERALEWNTKLGVKNPEKFISLQKLHNYKLDEKGFAKMYKLNLTYESALSSQYKWKFYFEEGVAIPEKVGNSGLVQGKNYQKQKYAFILISRDELLEALNDVMFHLQHWETSNYHKMLTFRDAYSKRRKDSNFDDDNEDKWNIRAK